MKFNNIENKCHIIKGIEVWESRAIAVVGMILVKHEGNVYVALGRRGKAVPNEVGKWCLPCGFLDWNESCEEAVVREIWEEIGVNINKIQIDYEVLKNQMDFPWKISSEPSHEQENVSMHYAIYLTTELMNEPKLPSLTIKNNVLEEVDETVWVKIDDLDKYDCAFGHDNSIKIYFNNIFGI